MGGSVIRARRITEAPPLRYYSQPQPIVSGEDLTSLPGEAFPRLFRQVQHARNKPRPVNAV